MRAIGTLIVWLRSWRPCRYDWMDDHDESANCQVCAIRRRRARRRAEDRTRTVRKRTRVPLPAAKIYHPHGERT